MKTCTYDNPATMQREAWQDGRLVAAISADLMHTKGFNGHPRMHMGLNVGRDFIPGEIHGDPSAIPAKRSTGAGSK